MISNERPSPFQPRRPKLAHHQFPPRPPIEETTLSRGEVQVERKTFVFLLKENPRGKFLRIIEDAGGKSNGIIVPYTGLEAFMKTLAETLKGGEQPPANPPAQEGRNGRRDTD